MHTHETLAPTIKWRHQNIKAQIGKLNVIHVSERVTRGYTRQEYKVHGHIYSLPSRSGMGTEIMRRVGYKFYHTRTALAWPYKYMTRRLGGLDVLT